MTIKTNSFEIVEDFPILSDNFAKFDLKKDTFGRASNDLIFNKNADYIFTGYNYKNSLKRTIGQDIPATKLILDRYMWDYSLDKFQNYATYKEYLDEAKKLGVQHTVGMDFSMFVGTPTPILMSNLYKNLLRLKQAQDMGFKAILNFNTVHSQFEKIYEHSLPKQIDTVFYDDNHSEFKNNRHTLKLDIDALETLTNISKINNFIIQSASIRPTYLYPFVGKLVDSGIAYTLIPSQTKLLQAVIKSQGRENGKR